MFLFLYFIFEKLSDKPPLPIKSDYFLTCTSTGFRKTDESLLQESAKGTHAIFISLCKICLLEIVMLPSCLS